jgi:tRNA G18 (ribose-2'-O)-methylase SpoU
VFHVRKIEAFDSPELQPYGTMRRQLEHREQGIFVAEGEKVVRRLLESSFAVVSVLLPEKWLAEFEPLLRARSEDIAVFIAEKALLETLTGFSMYQGLLAVGKVPARRSLEELLEAPHPRSLLAVEGLTSAQNLGGVVRNCVALGVQGLVVGENCVSPFLRRAVRSSMGTLFQLPVLESPSLRKSLEQLRRAGVRTIAAHPGGNLALPRADLTGDCCVILGSEGYGISPGILEVCDQALAIPMPPTVDSLNVGSAAAIFLYEISRQRGKF